MTCQTCTDTGRRGSCAPLRCYCGHESCHAFASWQPRTVPNVTSLPTRASSAWAEREESTWIDSM
jgi:hypothetical protein